MNSGVDESGVQWEARRGEMSGGGGRIGEYWVAAFINLVMQVALYQTMYGPEEGREGAITVITVSGVIVGIV
ncbi:hypothetical protein E2C01_069007 [Portunus trituberculatus]|uniref:Uncharacterized protein n=1 Tax=Portunus trituberculatus TaxID=210409 RepID=A0A5B7HY90_PORTR|nr:hypothetical protein [Portunus trituberculatus]